MKELDRKSNLPGLAKLLDNILTIPGTKISFGLDAIVGLIPVVGDIITTLFSFLIVYQAAVLGAPVTTLLRMLANISVDSIIGAIPLLGDLFDFVWKSNTKNLSLLQALPREELTPRSNMQVKRMVFVLLSVLALILVAGIVLLVRVIWSLFEAVV